MGASSHYHIMVRASNKEDKPFVSWKASYNMNTLYKEFRPMHEAQPDEYRFAYCVSEECKVDG